MSLKLRLQYPRWSFTSTLKVRLDFVSCKLTLSSKPDLASRGQAGDLELGPFHRHSNPRLGPCAAPTGCVLISPLRAWNAGLSPSLTLGAEDTTQPTVSHVCPGTWVLGKLGQSSEAQAGTGALDLREVLGLSRNLCGQTWTH